MRAQETTKKELDPGVSQMAKIFISVGFWAVTYITSLSLLILGTPSAGIRAAGVVIGVAGLLPWVWTAARAIANQDEFTRRTHYVALSCTFAATGVLLYALDLLTRAEFIGPVSYMQIWGFMVSAWLLSLVLTNRYYR